MTGNIKKGNYFGSIALRCSDCNVLGLTQNCSSGNVRYTDGQRDLALLFIISIIFLGHVSL